MSSRTGIADNRRWTMGMGLSFDGFQPQDGNRFRPKVNNRVLLREPERCPECNKVFISLYPLRICQDHQGLDEL